MLTAYQKSIIENKRKYIREAVSDARIPQPIVSSVKVVAEYPDVVLLRFGDSIDSHELDLEGLHLGPNDVQAYVAPFLQSFPMVTKLNLYNNKIGSEGCRLLSPGLTSITELNVGSNHIGCRGAKFIIKASVSLVKLDLTRNEIDDEIGIRRLALGDDSPIQKLITNEIIRQRPS